MNWKTIEKGYLGQLIVEEEFIKQDWNLFKPVLENGKVDLIVEKDNQYFRIQIKTVQNIHNKKFIPVRKITNNTHEYKIVRYTKEDIDYFIGVDIETKDLYILPIEFSSQYQASIRTSTCDEYKNNFSQLDDKISNLKTENN